MAQAKLNTQDKADSMLKDKEKESDEKEGIYHVQGISPNSATPNMVVYADTKNCLRRKLSYFRGMDICAGQGQTMPECAVCLQPCIYPAKLPCNHVYCYLCVKGVANQSKRCPMCRQEIPPDFLDRPQLVEVEEAHKELDSAEEEYQWFYQGINGWWQYDQRTSHELETAYKQGKRNCELLIAGFLYIADFGSMLQLRRNDPSRRRKIKRDLYNVPKKGVAGLRLNNQDDEIIREIRGAERPASPASDNMGTGDGTNTPIPPSNTPQTPAGGTASGDATPSNDRMEQRSDSLHQVLEQMRSLVLREHLSSSTDNELEEAEESESHSTHPTL